jgi:hypothetical protein
MNNRREKGKENGHQSEILVEKSLRIEKKSEMKLQNLLASTS